MVLLLPALDLSPFDALTLYHTIDPDLSDAPILVFIGPAQATGGNAPASSRIQCHIFTPAGIQSYPRLAISPGSLLYAAVNCLSRQDQGDEVCRALAYSIFKYFNELPATTRQEWVEQRLSADESSAAEKLFGETHAADLASKMRKAPDTVAVVNRLEQMFVAQSVSAVDADLVFPADSVRRLENDASTDDTDTLRYGPYAELVALFGENSFIPNSKLRRAPSRPLPANRSRTFSRQQKEALRREICELLDTEESYVHKLDKFVQDVASDLRQKSKSRKGPDSSPSPSALSALFPPSLDEIVKLNNGFFHDLLAVVEGTEAAAIDDIEQTKDQSTTSATSKDLTGATEVAKCLIDWLPKFRDCYGHYISAHADFGLVLKGFMSDKSSSFASRVHEVGEQKLLSTLIEPVQRLARYSLYLENIIKQLPLKHPALPPFLKAKDLVAELCAQDSSNEHNSRIISNLRRLVQLWPQNFLTTSRLVAAIDLEELASESEAQPASLIGLLFTSHFVLVEKLGDESLTARGLFAEVDGTRGAGPNVDALNVPAAEPLLIFQDYVPLASVNVNEMSGGTALRFVPASAASENTGSLRSCVRTFSVTGGYAERAARFCREVLKARTEGRFSDQLRESGLWELREFDAQGQGLAMVTAVFDERLESKQQLSRPVVRIAVDSTKRAVMTSKHGSSMSADISCQGNGFYRVEVSSALSQTTRDLVTRAEFMPVLTKRLSAVLQMYISLRNPAIACSIIRHNEEILRSLRLPTTGRGRSPSRSKASRPHSPVKAFANLFGGTAKESPGHKKAPSTTQLFEKTPVMRPQLGPKAPSESSVTVKPPEAAPKVTIVRGSDSNGVAIDKLERCLANYLLALQARKGNVVGRVISNRRSADQAVIDELTQSVLGEPEDNEAAANSSVDVLFAAFEKFLKTSWQEQLGPVIGCAILDEMQRKSNSLNPLDYEEYLQTKLDDLSPQNRRAFKGILETFIDLLSGMSNDGDRGILVATMTEILVSGGRPHDFMSIFDRFIEEHDTILNDPTRSGNTTPYQGSMASSVANRSAYTGSFSSKASSLGRRFGLTSSTENAKSSESKIGSVFRSMSKSSRVADGSLREKNALSRPRSIEFSAKSSPHSRPGSRDGFTDALAVEEAPSRPGTGRSWDQLEPMESLHEAQEVAVKPARKPKRRSSLSDVEGLPLPNTSPFWDAGTPSLRRPVMENSPLARHGLTATRDPTPQLTPGSQTKAHLSMPLRRAGTVVAGQAHDHRLARGALLGNQMRVAGQQNTSSDRKENLPPVTPDRAAPRGLTGSPQKNILSERPGSGNTPPVPVSSSSDVFTGSPNKAAGSVRRRLPAQTSPQKLREQVQTQKAAVNDAESGLREELAKIGEELAALNLSASPSKPVVSATARVLDEVSTPRQANATLQNVSGRLKALEARLPHMISNLTRRIEGLQSDVDAAQHSANDSSRVVELERHVEQRHVEIAELQKRHDEEIRRLYEQHRRGRQQSEMERKMLEAMEEAARWRAECDTLRKENASLHAQIDRL